MISFLFLVGYSNLFFILASCKVLKGSTNLVYMWNLKRKLMVMQVWGYGFVFNLWV